MSNKQSSIDTAIEQIYQKILDSKNPNATTKRGGDYRIGLRAAIDILEELKEMHRQEIEDKKQHAIVDKEKISELIKSIYINKANFDYCSETLKINGTLYSEIERIVLEYANIKEKYLEYLLRCEAVGFYFYNNDDEATDSRVKAIESSYDEYLKIKAPR